LRAAVSMDPATFDRYAGSFRIDSRFILTITREGDWFFAQLTGQPKVRIYPRSEIEFFFATAVDGWISFRANQQADSLVLHQNGRDSAARRVDTAEAQAGDAAQRKRRAATKERRPAGSSYTSSAGAYVGFYEADPTNVLVITRAGQQLFAQLTGQRRLSIFPAGGSEYAYGAADARITFVNEGDSLASELVLHLKDRDLHLPRVGDLPSTAAGHVDVGSGLLISISAPIRSIPKPSS
jgi:serine-type D-Ala-D-Ala carboxypeptidase/endopeptidase